MLCVDDNHTVQKHSSNFLQFHLRDLIGKQGQCVIGVLLSLLGGYAGSSTMKTFVPTNLVPSAYAVPRRLLTPVALLCSSPHAQQLAKSAVADVIGHEPKVTAIHAGLECGILGERLPGCDMVSYGPTILGAHSPDERLDISTVQPFWDATLLLMSALADLKA